MEASGAHGAGTGRGGGAVLRAPVVIVGLGNEIASDDAVGIHVARALEPDFRESSFVDVVALPWAGFALLDVLRGRSRAALVDCLTTGLHRPGSIVRLSADDFAGSVRLNSFHDISYPTVMDLGRRLGWEMPDDVAIWGIEAEQTDEFGEDLSPAVEAAVAGVVSQIKEYVNTNAELIGAAT